MNRQDATLHDVLIWDSRVHKLRSLFKTYHFLQTGFDLDGTIFLVLDSQLQILDLLRKCRVLFVVILHELVDAHLLIMILVHLVE